MNTITFQVWDLSEKFPESYQLLYLYTHDNVRCIGFYSGVYKKFVEIYTANNIGSWIDMPKEKIIKWRYLDDVIEEKFKTNND